MSNLFNQVKDADLKDHTVPQKGFERKPLAEGPAIARFVGYVELGNHVKQFEGKDKPTAPQVRLTFELFGRHAEERTNDQGEKSTFNPTISVELPLSLNEKASFFKLMKKMAAGRSDITNMAQMLGEAFVLTITNKASAKDPKRVHSNLKAGGEWGVAPPYIVDPLTNETKAVPVPPMTGKVQQLLLWDSPSKEQWDSIFIDGTYERKVGDEVVQVSKNFIQEEILSADNFAGSSLAALLEGEGLEDLIANLQQKPAEEDVDVIESDEPAAEEKPSETPEADLPEAPAEEPVAEKTEAEILAELGL